MMPLQGDLSPSLIGAEVLCEMAQERVNGVLVWTRPTGTTELEFSAGRPVRLRNPEENGSKEPERTTLALRAFACAISGSYRFNKQEVKPSATAIDPLGEALVALLTAVTPAQLSQIWQARRNLTVSPTPNFDTIHEACRQLGAPPLVVSARGERLVDVVHEATLPVQRTVATLLFLGGLSVRAAPRVESAGPPGITPAPVDTPNAAVVAEIETAYAAAQSQTYYELLGVARDASVETIRKGYLELAKRWHSDRFASLDLGPAAAKAAELFRRAGEAQAVLTDAEQRKAYDFVAERHSQGLPTDPRVILEAEALFKKAQALVRRGQAAPALALLQQAVELNKGEAEFWVYLGYALYGANGSTAVQQAETHIRHGLELRERQDVAYEFLGRIARVEGRVDEARRNLRHALEINPRNSDAQRDLRLISMRAGKPAPAPAQSLGGFFGKLFKRG